LWDQRGNDLLGHIFSRGPEQILKLRWRELANDGGLLLNVFGKLLLEFLKPFLLLEQILYKSSSTFKHLVEPALKSLHDTQRLTRGFFFVLTVPDVVSDKAFDLLQMRLTHLR